MVFAALCRTFLNVEGTYIDGLKRFIIIILTSSGRFLAEMINSRKVGIRWGGSVTVHVRDCALQLIVSVL